MEPHSHGGDVEAVELGPGQGFWDRNGVEEVPDVGTHLGLADPLIARAGVVLIDHALGDI
jgi:hypothetical protein